jgi:hypothetical protein
MMPYLILIIVGIPLVFLVAMYITKSLKPFMDVRKVGKLLDTMELENKRIIKGLENKHQEAVSEIKTLKEQNTLLETQNKELRHNKRLLEANLKLQQATNDNLLAQVKYREKEHGQITEKIELLEMYQRDFEERLFKYLTLHTKINPAEIKAELGLPKRNPNDKNALL